MRRAARQLAAATAWSGVATADGSPQLSLTGSLRLARVPLTALCTPARRFWSVGPTLGWPICDTGCIRAHIAVQEAQTAPQLSAYEPTALQALEEVENARVAYGREQARRIRLADAVAANQWAVACATAWLYTV